MRCCRQALRSSNLSPSLNWQPSPLQFGKAHCSDIATLLWRMARFGSCRSSTQDVPRRLAPILDSLVDEEPVIALHGPRSVGKSTLLRSLAASRGVEVLDLDDPAVRDAASASPALAVSGTGLVCIDEYQHVPALLDALKAKLNANGSAPGYGSPHGLHPSGRHSARRASLDWAAALHDHLAPLAGRARPEPRRTAEPACSADPGTHSSPHGTHSTTTRAEYVERVCAGGLPLAVRRTGAGSGPLVRRLRQPDRRARRRRPGPDPTAAATPYPPETGSPGSTGQLSMASKAADALRANRNTGRELHPAPRGPLPDRAAARLGHDAAGALLMSTPKVHVVDSGLAARLTRSLAESRLGTPGCDRPERVRQPSRDLSLSASSASRPRGWTTERLLVTGEPTTRTRSTFVLELGDGRVHRLRGQGRRTGQRSAPSRPAQAARRIGRPIHCRSGFQPGNPFVYLRRPVARPARRPALVDPD